MRSGPWNPADTRVREGGSPVYSISYEKKPGYLHVHIEGPETLKAAIQFWEDLAIKARKESHRKFLIVDEVEGKLDTSEVFDLSVKVSNLFAGAVIAYVDPKEDTFDANKFGEIVVRNRGVDATVFHSIPEAVAWLEKE
jgi:hypothetical protein